MDTSCELLSVALDSKTGVFYTEVDTVSGPSHSEFLLECAEGLCKTAGIRPSELGKVLCMNGPGSFTGLRIGFSTAKGLALALGIPLLALPTLDCIAYSFSSWPGIILPAIDAKKGCFFTAFYRDGKRLTDFLDLSPETLVTELIKTRNFPDEPLLLTGSGAELLLSRLSEFNLQHIKIDPYFRIGKARELLEIAKSSIYSMSNYNDLGPIYLRKSDAEQNFG